MATLFLCHSSIDSEFVCQVAAYLKRHFDVFYYEDHQRADRHFIATVNEALRHADAMTIFVGAGFNASDYQQDEALFAAEQRLPAVVVPLAGSSADGGIAKRPADLPNKFPYAPFSGRPFVTGHLGAGGVPVSVRCAHEIINALFRTDRERFPAWNAVDGLPENPHLFSYEKDIIEFFIRKERLGSELFREAASEKEEKERADMRDKLLRGCPSEWPRVVDLTLGSPGLAVHPNPLSADEIGKRRPRDAHVAAAALRRYLETPERNPATNEGARQPDFSLPEAGPREDLAFPIPGHDLRVGIVVSGGIAPGINAVIDGIVQRHWLYARIQNHNVLRYPLQIRGYRNGFFAFAPGAPSQAWCDLIPDDWWRVFTPHGIPTARHAAQAGSLLGTFRQEELRYAETREIELQRIAAKLQDIDILYAIGGDGSMKAAHAIWTYANAPGRTRNRGPLSVVAIPKTMDNDILWMWQSFGFLSAVERAKEIIEQLHTEVESNPRVCILQLFGSDSGFVVSHAVQASEAGQCDLALIPEVTFSMLGIARHLKKKICESHRGLPYALVVMAETAIPVDALEYVGDDDGPVHRGTVPIRLTPEEQEAIEEYDKNRKSGKRIEGQTSDVLRTAGLKIVMKGLRKLLPEYKLDMQNFYPEWQQLRIFSNEPRHLLRAIPPSTSDIITGQRLGVLAVDNAMAGYSDFMISQWLTEFVLVPLPLVVLGRKRIPQAGIFWKSCLAKTQQPSNLVDPWQGR